MEMKVQLKRLPAKERAAIALQVIRQHPVAFALFGAVHVFGMAWGVFMAGRIAQWW